MFCIKGNNESGNSAKRERSMSKGSRSRWDNSDIKLLLMQTYKWHGIPATAITFSAKRASKNGISVTDKTFSMKHISGME